MFYLRLHAEKDTGWSGQSHILVHSSTEIDAFRVSGVPELTISKILSGVRARRASSPKTVLAFEFWTSAQLTDHFFYYPACGRYYPAEKKTNYPGAIRRSNSLPRFWNSLQWVRRLQN